MPTFVGGLTAAAANPSWEQNLMGFGVDAYALHAGGDGQAADHLRRPAAVACNRIAPQVHKIDRAGSSRSNDGPIEARIDSDRRSNAGGVRGEAPANLRLESRNAGSSSEHGGEVRRLVRDDRAMSERVDANRDRDGTGNGRRRGADLDG
jgi:hypothetical protein